MQRFSSCLRNFNSIMLIITKIMNLRRMMGQTRLRAVKRQNPTPFLTHHSSRRHNLSYFWNIRLKLCTHLDNDCRYHENIPLIYSTIRKIFEFSTPYIFWDTRYLRLHSLFLDARCRYKINYDKLPLSAPWFHNSLLWIRCELQK